MEEAGEPRLSASEVDKAYHEARTKFEAAANRAEQISVGAAGRLAETGRAFWASVLFTRLTVTAKSVLLLAPWTVPLPNHQAHWDFSAVASLVRNMAECYFVFFHLCAEPVEDEDEWQMRQNLMQLRDNKARWRMFKDWNPDDPQLVGFAAHHADLNERLKSRSHFRALPAKTQNELLKGEKDLFTQDEILERMGKDRASFRGYYRFLSAHTHTGPISFYRMAEQGRGSGVENRRDKSLTATALSVALDFLSRANEDMLQIFPDAEHRGAGRGRHGRG